MTAEVLLVLVFVVVGCPSSSELSGAGIGNRVNAAAKPAAYTQLLRKKGRRNGCCCHCCVCEGEEEEEEEGVRPSIGASRGVLKAGRASPTMNSAFENGRRKLEEA